MRTFGPSFTYANQASEKAPRFVLKIAFDDDPIYLTSHAGIPDVPDTVIPNVLQRPSAISQKIVPDEGRSEIGAISFSAIDKNSVLTDAIRARLTDGEGVRHKVVELLQGFSRANFTQYQRFQTQIIQGVSYNEGVYSFKCSDITREQRKDIFDPKRTNLRESISASATTIPVFSTDAFEMVEHGTSFSDAPSSTVGYVKIADEWIRYADKTGGGDPAFIGCTRGVLNTRAVAHTVDVTEAQDQRPKVEEGIYLELPLPKLALAILTGELYGQSGATLPDHWHLGIDANTWINTDDFTGIGQDLWHPDADAISFVGRFHGLKKTDGKRFLEKEVYMLMGCYPIVYSDGRIGVRRMNHVLADAPAVVEINENNAVSWSELTHDLDGMSNAYRVEWNFVNDKPTRVTQFFDAESISIHGQTDIKTLQFKGLYGSRHTDATVRARIDALRQRYSHPPETMSATVLPSLNALEVGDIVRVKLPAVRDFAATGAYIDRSFEIQRMSVNHATGEVTLQLFGSSARASEYPTSGDPGGEGPDEENSLPDAWYASEGTELSTVVDITLVGDVGVIDVDAWDLPGNADLEDAAAIYYYDGDLELPDGAVLNLDQNVQLRVRGFFTINGEINGVGAGLEGVADTAGYGTTAQGQAGFLGNSRGMDGLVQGRRFPVTVTVSTLSASLTRGQVVAVPRFDLTVEAGELAGLPTDLRGTSGGPGGKVVRTEDQAVRGQGGTGGAGGAGLCIVCRGLAFGASGSIDLSGADSDATTAIGPPDMLPGAGGAGAPGALLIVLDGFNISLPDLGGKFFAVTGHVDAPLARTLINPSGGVFSGNLFTSGSGDAEGYNDPAMISDVDMSNSAYQIIYVAGQQTPVEDTPSAVPAPTDLDTSEIVGLGIKLTAELPAFDQFDTVEYWGSDDNDRDNATIIASIKASTVIDYQASPITRYFWARCVRGSLNSDWYPASDTAGIEGEVT